MFNGGGFGQFFGSRSSNANSRSSRSASRSNASRSNSGRSNNSRRSNNSHNSRMSQCACSFCSQPIEWYALFRHIDTRRYNATQQLFLQMDALEIGRVTFVEAELYMPSPGEVTLYFQGPPGVTNRSALIEYAIVAAQECLRSNRTLPAVFPSIGYR